jgi:hypothetical protein
VYSYGIIWLHITAGTFTTQWQTVSVPAIFLLYRGRHIIQNMVMEKIRLKKEEDWNLNCLEQEIMIAANQIDRFNETFIHCGYQWI